MSGPQRARHRPTEIEVWDFEGFGPGQNGFAVMAWINSGGGDAHADDDGNLYIKNEERERTRNWLKPGVDKVARRFRWPDMTPTNDFYRLEPEVWDDAYDAVDTP